MGPQKKIFLTFGVKMAKFCPQNNFILPLKTKLGPQNSYGSFSSQPEIISPKSGSADLVVNQTVVADGIEGSFPASRPVVLVNSDTANGSSEKLHLIALGCYYLLWGVAQVRFPSTDRGHPSETVRIERTVYPLFRSGDSQVFPIIVDWRRWKFGVLPVLQDSRWKTDLPINNRLVVGALEKQVGLIRESLYQSYINAGFLSE